MTIATKPSVGAMRAAQKAITIKSYPAFGGGNRWTLSLAGKGINTYQSQEEAEQAASPLRSLLAELISAETHDTELLEALENEHWALTSILDSIGALTNPSELHGMGLTDFGQTRILAEHARTTKAIAKAKEGR